MSGKPSKSSKVPEGPPRRIREGVNEWKVQGTRFHVDERYRVIKAVSPCPIPASAAQRGGGGQNRARHAGPAQQAAEDRGRSLRHGSAAGPPAPLQPLPSAAPRRAPPSAQIGHGAYGVVV